jgi:hypothetical protein
MSDSNNAIITNNDYLNLMLVLNAIRGMVKNSFPDSLNVFDTAFGDFIGEVTKGTALSLREQGYDDKSIHELMSLSDEDYGEINVLVMQIIQGEMAGEWEKAGIHSEADIDKLCHEVRNEVKAEYPVLNADTIQACSERDYVGVNSFDEMIELAKNTEED